MDSPLLESVSFRYFYFHEKYKKQFKQNLLYFESPIWLYEIIGQIKENIYF